nr:hypothetical protein [Tanacetum cinerariifolium]
MDVIEKGLWIIRSILIILNKWSRNVSLTKEDLKKVHVWVKLRDVPLVGFNQDGLSAIATKVGKLIMLDSYTSIMCMESWGRLSYARAMVVISAINEINESIMVATPSLVGGEKMVDTVTRRILPQLGWIIGGLVIGSHRNLDAKQSEGILVGKSKQRWYYRAKTTNVTEDVGTSNQNANTSKKLNDNAMTILNSSNKYDALAGIDENIEHVEPHSNNEEQIEDVEANMDQTTLFMTNGNVTVGASTPSHKKDLNTHKPFMGVHPWVIMDDFNASLCLEDSSTGSSRITISMREFKECVDSIEVIDVNQTGMRFTWNQKPNAESAILSGADNRPPMLEKDIYDSWKSIMELYILNKQHGRMILESVENGPLLWLTVEENGVTKSKKYFELTVTEAIQADCDINVTYIILQGLPPEVYALVSTHKVVK